MSKRAKMTTKQYLIDTPLPQHTETYTVISHEFIINKTLQVLAEKGFEVKHELYRCNEAGDIAQGVYHLKFNGVEDPEMSMMFAWSNSYDKTMRFKCAVGGFLNESKSTILCGNMGSWGRKHTGTADEEAEETIKTQIENAEKYYQQLVDDKAILKTLLLTKERRAEIIGKLYIVNELLTSEQLSVVREQLKKPSFNYNTPTDSAWTMYMAMTYALQKAHPRTWMDQQRMIHWSLIAEFGVKIGDIYQLTPMVVSMPEEKVTNQITIEQVIAEEESKVIIEEITLSSNTGGKPVIYPVLTSSEEVGGEKTESEILTILEEITSEKEVVGDPWPCLDCGEEQPGNAPWHDGQLCTKCSEKL